MDASPLDQVYCTASVMNLALYVDKGECCLNGKLFPKELLLLVAK